jgi:hypothetical protein
MCFPGLEALDSDAKRLRSATESDFMTIVVKSLG